MTMPTQTLAAHQRLAEDLVVEASRHDGLAPLDLERFWSDQALAIADPFGADIPQLPFGAFTTGECVFEELGIQEDHRRYQDDEPWRLELNRTYNDKAERIVGRRLLNERRCDPDLAWPAVKGLHDLFEARNVWVDQSWWLMPSASTADELEALLDRVDGRDIRRFILPDGWAEAKQRLVDRGAQVPLYRGQRGPVTFATSVFGVENFLFLLLDKPDLAVRFRDTILRVMLEIARVLDEEAGYTPDTAPRGFSFADDNCCLLTPELYELFGYPILEGVFDRYAPDARQGRHQHSDSDMSHLLPVLARLDFTSVNFGPAVTADRIRAHMPNTVIRGVLAPFTYSRNEETGMVQELLRDYEHTRATRGLVFATAGSVNNGSRLTGMRLLMAAIQRHARYDGSSLSR